MCSSVLSERLQIKKLCVLERDIMLKLKMQHEAAQLFGAKSSTQVFHTVHPGSVTLPVGSSSAHASNIVPDHSTTPAMENGEVLRLASERTIRLQKACQVANVTKEKLKQEIANALANRDTRDSHSEAESQASVTSMFHEKLPTSLSQPGKKRKYDRFTTDKDLSDENNNFQTEEDNMCNDSKDSIVIDDDMPTLQRFDVLDAEEEEDVLICEPPELPRIPQEVDVDRTINFDNLVDNLTCFAGLTRLVDKDHMQRVRLPPSPQLSSTLSAINAQFSADVLDERKKSRSFPQQPKFFNRFTAAGDRVENPRDVSVPFQGATRFPNAFCSLLDESTPTIPTLDGGNVLIPGLDVHNIEGSLAYCLKTLDIIHRTMLFDSQLLESKLQALADVKAMMEESDIPPEFSAKIEFLYKHSLAQ